MRPDVPRGGPSSIWLTSPWREIALIPHGLHMTRNKSFVSLEVTSVISVTEKLAEYDERGYAHAVSFVMPALTLLTYSLLQGLRCWNIEQTAA